MSRWFVVPVCVSGGGSPHCLITRPFIRCSGRLFPRQWHVLHIPPVPCMCVFSVLVPAGQGGGRSLDTSSTTMYQSSNSLHSWFQVAVSSLSGLHLAGLPGGRAGLQTSFAGLAGGPAASYANNALRQLS